MSKKIHHHLSFNTTVVALFSVILILTGGGIGLPLLQQQKQQVYGSSQVQGPASSSSPLPTQAQSPSSQMQLSRQPLAPTQAPPPPPRPATPICDPNSPLLQYRSTGGKVAELQRLLTQAGYGSLLLGQSGGGGGGGIDGKFGTSTQNAVKKFQQDNRLQVDGKVGPITWRALCFKTTIPPTAPTPVSPPPPTFASIPIQTEPVLPRSAAINTPSTPFPNAAAKCGSGIHAGFDSSQWVTVKPGFNRPLDYRLLEGKVLESHISRKDAPFNHDSFDQNALVRPDPINTYLLSSSGETEKVGSDRVMEVEWEYYQFPDNFWPTRGDRISAFGYYIHDCAHGYPTEIHPPVGIAVHRPRPIMIDLRSEIDFNGDGNPDPGMTVGSNVFVPGIVTDIWFNRNGGAALDCGTTSLHDSQWLTVNYGSKTIRYQNCLRNPSPINRIFEFNIYLPKSPEAIARSAGITTDLPHIPLYKKVLNPYTRGNTGPDPIITQVTEGDITYLKVRLDLTHFTGNEYSRRIVSGWVYPSPNNWDLERWHLTINNINVRDDSDSFLKGNGDWRFWINTNNIDHEWTKIFDCDGCVTGKITFGGRPWATGVGSPFVVPREHYERTPNDNLGRYLGPDILLWPPSLRDIDLFYRYIQANTFVWVHSSGYDDDSTTGDSTGQVNGLIPQIQSTYSTPSQCISQGVQSGCGSYILSYSLTNRGHVSPASLSQPSQRIFDSYKVSPNASVFVRPSINTLLKMATWPIQIAGTSNDEQVVLSNEELQSLKVKIPVLKQQNPSLLDNTMKNIRDEIALLKKAKPSALAENTDSLIRLKEGIPQDIWDRYLGDIMNLKTQSVLSSRPAETAK
jgi:peptidoglycan hydrolase-like protein with peptidoglycan-binding domain